MANGDVILWKRIEQLYKMQGKVSYDDIRGIALESGYMKKTQVDRLIHDAERIGKLQSDPDDMWYYSVALVNEATIIQKIEHKMTNKGMFQTVFDRYKEHRALASNPAARHEWVLGWKYEIGEMGLTVDEFETYAAFLIGKEKAPTEDDLVEAKARVVAHNYEISDKTAEKRSAEAAAKLMGNGGIKQDRVKEVTT